MLMKRLVFTLCGLLTTMLALANADVTVSLSGVKNGDNVTLSVSSNAFMKTINVTADGDYVFTDVPVGKHAVKVETSGYNLPDTKYVRVNEDGSVDPMTGIKIVITKMSDDESTWTHSWHEDGSIAGYTTSAYVNTPPTVEFLGKKIVPSDVPSHSILLDKYCYVLSDDGEPWTQEYAYRLMETMKTIYDYNWNRDTTIIKLTADAIADDIKVETLGGGKEVTISKDAFVYANPYLVNLDGVRGRFFSKRLHHALVNLVTDFGNNRDKANEILMDKYGCSIYPPSYEELTVTHEDAARFQEFHPQELVSIINMFEEMPTGFHKISNLKYLIRRQNGHPHPLYPDAAAVSWPTLDTGYIEFMEKAFNGKSLIDGAQRLILHEKAHFLWAKTFSDQIKNDWIELGGWYLVPGKDHDSWATTKDTEFVSAYAHAINPDEDMAESIAAYINEPEKLRSRALEKYEFIRDRIMHGTRYISSIPSHLTFEVLNLNPDYDYPGKIKSLDVKVEGKPEEDKIVTVDITLNHMEGFDDGASGAGLRVSSPAFIKDGKTYFQFHDLGLAPVDGDPFHLSGSITISKYSKTGYWTVGDIVVSDIQGNQRFEGSNDFVWNMYLNNPLEDLEPPVYEKGSLNYTLTDSIIDGREGQNLCVSWKVTDNVEVEKTFVRLGRNDGSYSFADFYGTYDEKTHTAHVNIPITEYFHCADYYAEFISVYDLAQTVTDVCFSDSPLDEPRKSIHVETKDPDTIAPELDLNRIVVYAEPTNKEAPDGETLVTINFYARDDKSGFNHGGFRLLDPQGLTHFDYHSHRNTGTSYFDGDPTLWEKYTIKRVLPKGSAPGIWGLSEMSLIDKAWNEKIYNFVETLIFEPDDNESDYVLFANIEDNSMLNFDLTSDKLNGFGFNYRIISDVSGEEISGSVDTNGSVTTRARATRATDGYHIDISALPDGKIILITQILDRQGEVTAVKSITLEKSNTSTGIESRFDERLGTVESVTYIGIDGRQSAATSKGLKIAKIKYADGTVRQTKIVD